MMRLRHNALMIASSLILVYNIYVIFLTKTYLSPILTFVKNNEIWSLQEGIAPPKWLFTAGDTLDINTLSQHYGYAIVLGLLSVVMFAMSRGGDVYLGSPQSIAGRTSLINVLIFVILTLVVSRALTKIGDASLYTIPAFKFALVFSKMLPSVMIALAIFYLLDYMSR